MSRFGFWKDQKKPVKKGAEKPGKKELKQPPAKPKFDPWGWGEWGWSRPGRPKGEKGWITNW